MVLGLARALRFAARGWEESCQSHQPFTPIMLPEGHQALFRYHSSKISGVAFRCSSSGIGAEGLSNTGMTQSLQSQETKNSDSDHHDE